MKDIYRTGAGVLTLLAVIVQYVLVTQDRSGAALLTTSVHFFSFFTILTNLLAAAALLLPVVWRRPRVSRFFERASVRTAITGYIIMVGVVYHLLLRDVSQAEGATLLVERSLHYVTVPLFVLDWLLFVPKGEVGWTVGVQSLGFPLLYAAWMLLLGAVSGWYPYPFLDVTDLGYPLALLNIAGLVLAFLVLELVLVAIDRLMQRIGISAA